MLGGVFHLHEQEAREVMTPIPAVITVNASETVEEALQRCVSSGHTRLIVIEDDNPDRVRGVVHNNSLARLYMNAGPDTSIEPAIREVPIFPETKPLDDLLAELQRQRSSIAVVSDEYGRTVGIVTVEDILEEVVGEIEDETDPRAASMRQLTDGDWYVAGPRLAGRPRGRGDPASGLLGRLQLDRRLRLLGAWPPAQARRQDPGERLRDQGRVGERKPHRRGSHPPVRDRRISPPDGHGRGLRPAISGVQAPRLPSANGSRLRAVRLIYLRGDDVGGEAHRQAARGPEGRSSRRRASGARAARGAGSA